MPRPRKPRHGALFDLDGTIAKTEELIHASWSRIGPRFGFDFSAFQYERIIGKDGLIGCQIVIEHFGLKADAEEMLEAFRVMVRKCIATDLSFCTGARETLEMLQQRRVPMALVSAGPDVHVQAVFDRLELWPFFEAIINKDHPDWGRGKPFGDPYLAAAKALGRQPGECTVFEDAPPGVEAGRAAGCYVIAIPHEHSPKAGLGAANLILDNLGLFHLGLIGL